MPAYSKPVTISQRCHPGPLAASHLCRHCRRQCVFSQGETVEEIAEIAGHSRRHRYRAFNDRWLCQWQHAHDTDDCVIGGQRHPHLGAYPDDRAAHDRPAHDAAAHECAAAASAASANRRARRAGPAPSQQANASAGG